MTPRHATCAGGDCSPRLDVANEQPLSMRVPTFLSSARGERPLQRPRVTIRVAKLTLYTRQVDAACTLHEHGCESSKRRSFDRNGCGCASQCRERRTEVGLKRMMVRAVLQQQNSRSRPGLERRVGAAPPLGRVGWCGR